MRRSEIVGQKEVRLGQRAKHGHSRLMDASKHADIRRAKTAHCVDQKDNELSLSLQVEIEPEEAGWPLFFVDYNTTVRPGAPPPKVISLDAWHVETAAQLLAELRIERGKAEQMS